MARTALTVRLDTAALERDLAKLSDAVAARALARVLNRVIVSVRKEASRLVREELNLRAGDVLKLLSVRRARAREASAELHVAAKPAGLILYGARQTRRGVSVKVKRRGARKVVQSAFIATMPKSGHRGVWRRDKGAARLPISELFSTALVQYLDDDQVLRRLIEVAERRFAEEMQREIAYRLGRRAA